MNLNFSFLSKYWPMFVRGAGTTLILSFFTVLIGLIIGVFLALLRLGKTAQHFADGQVCL